MIWPASAPNKRIWLRWVAQTLRGPSLSIQSDTDAQAVCFIPSGYPTSTPGGCLNKKDGLTRYGDSHVKDKTS